MSRKIVRLTLDNLEALPAPCRSCLFWERDPVRRSRAEDPAAEKDAWVSHVLREWGSCGRVALVDDEPVGYLIYAPEAFVPGAAGFPTAPVSPDAVLLTTAYVAPEHARRRAGPDAGAGHGPRPDQARHQGVEAFGDTRGKGSSRACCRSSSSAAWASRRNGRTAPRPRMRMELRTAITWRTEVEAALERLVGAVRPSPKTTRAPEGHPRGGRVALSDASACPDDSVRRCSRTAR